MEEVPLMTAEAAPGRSAKRYKLTCILATIALSAVGLAHSLSRHDATAPTAPAAVNAAERSAIFDHSDDDDDGSNDQLDDDGSNDQLDDDGLYECTMGRPSVATAYANGSWGTIEGEWYVVAGKFGNTSDAAGDCCRMKFSLPGDRMNQWMMYNNDDDKGTAYYFWNYTGSKEYKDETGLWYDYGSDDNGGITYDNFWSNVFLAGTHDGARWFGWYECGKGVTVTEDGIPWILSEDKDAHKDSSFTAMVEEKMADLLSWSDDDDKYEFTVYKQDDCDYTWHHIAINEGDRRYLAVQEGSA